MLCDDATVAVLFSTALSMCFQNLRENSFYLSKHPNRTTSLNRNITHPLSLCDEEWKMIFRVQEKRSFIPPPHLFSMIAWHEFHNTHPHINPTYNVDSIHIYIMMTLNNQQMGISCCDYISFRYLNNDERVGLSWSPILWCCGFWSQKKNRESEQR